MNHNQKGCFAECHFAAIAIQHGYNVSTPLISSSYYDCILEKDGIMFKIQIKYLGKDRRRHKNSIQITLRRTGLPSYEKKFVDFFALWDKHIFLAIDCLLSCICVGRMFIAKSSN